MNIVVPNNSTDGISKLEVEDLTHEPCVYVLSNAYLYNNIIFTSDEIRNNTKQFNHFFHSSYRVGKYYDLNEIMEAQFIYMRGTYINAAHWFHGNYSHFTAQGISNYIYCKHKSLISSDTKLIINNTIGFQSRLLDILCIDRSKIFAPSLNVLYQLEMVIITEMTYKYLFPKINTYACAEIANWINPEQDMKIYITRSDSSKRYADNENEVQSFLRDRGFSIYSFVGMPVDEQIRLIRKAHTIVAPHGASGINLLYKKEHEFKFVEIFCDYWVNTLHASILMEKNCNYSAFVNKSEASERVAKVHPQSIIHSPYKVSLELLEESLEYTNFKFRIQRTESSNSDAVTLLSRNSYSFISKWMSYANKYIYNIDSDEEYKRLLYYIFSNYILSEDIIRELNIYDELLYDFMSMKRLVYHMIQRYSPIFIQLNEDAYIDNIFKLFGITCNLIDDLTAISNIYGNIVLIISIYNVKDYCEYIENIADAIKNQDNISIIIICDDNYSVDVNLYLINVEYPEIRILDSDNISNMISDTYIDQAYKIITNITCSINHLKERMNTSMRVNNDMARLYIKLLEFYRRNVKPGIGPN